MGLSMVSACFCSFDPKATTLCDPHPLVFKRKESRFYTWVESQGPRSPNKIRGLAYCQKTIKSPSIHCIDMSWPISTIPIQPPSNWSKVQIASAPPRIFPHRWHFVQPLWTWRSFDTDDCGHRGSPARAQRRLRGLSIHTFRSKAFELENLELWLPRMSRFPCD